MRLHVQLSRYAVVGFAHNSLGYLLYLLLTFFGLEHKIAMSLIYFVAVTLSFFLNRRWTFGHVGLASKAFYRYVIAYLLGYVINLSILWFGADYLQIPHQVVQFVAVFVVAGCLFIIQKFWVFPPGVSRNNPV